MARGAGKHAPLPLVGLEGFARPASRGEYDEWLDSLRREPGFDAALLSELASVEKSTTRGFLLACDADLRAIASGAPEAKPLKEALSAAGFEGLLWRRSLPDDKRAFDDAMQTLGRSEDGSHLLLRQMNKNGRDNAIATYRGVIQKPVAEVVGDAGSLRAAGFASEDEARRYLRQLEDLSSDPQLVQAMRTSDPGDALDAAVRRLRGSTPPKRLPVHVDDVIEQAKKTGKPEVAGWLSGKRGTIITWTAGIVSLGVLYRLASGEDGEGPIGALADGYDSMVRDTVRLLLSPIGAGVEAAVEEGRRFVLPLAVGIAAFLILIALRRPLWALLRLVMRGIPWPPKRGEKPLTAETSDMASRVERINPSDASAVASLRGVTDRPPPKEEGEDDPEPLF